MGHLRPSWEHLEKKECPSFGTVKRLRHLGPFWGPFWSPKLALFWSFLGSFFGPLFGHFLDHFWAHFGTHFGTKSAQEGAKMSPRGPLRASSTQKPAFAKTLKSHLFFKVFGVQRPPKRALGGPRRLPRSTQGAPKPQQKRIQKWIPKLSIC